MTDINVNEVAPKIGSEPVMYWLGSLWVDCASTLNKPSQPAAILMRHLAWSAYQQGKVALVQKRPPEKPMNVFEYWAIPTGKARAA